MKEFRYAICNLSCIPVLLQPKVNAEVVSELLFGESYEVVEVLGGYSRIRIAHDEYEGWIDSRHTCAVSEEEYENNISSEVCAAVDLISHVTSSSGSKLVIPRGAFLPYYKDGCFQCGDNTYSFSGEVCSLNNPLCFERLEEVASSALGCPYRWGGRSPLGMDCSGFVQVVFRLFGISLLRDTYQQITQGENVDSLVDGKPGDLFFGFSVIGNLRHVGIILHGNKIVHCSGKVRIDELVEDGIYDPNNKNVTHVYEAVRRFSFSQPC